MFTLFWAGRDFAPSAIIDGVNIQNYLQSHFIAACKYLAKRIHDAGDLEGDALIQINKKVAHIQKDSKQWHM